MRRATELKLLERCIAALVKRDEDAFGVRADAAWVLCGDDSSVPPATARLNGISEL